MHAEQPRNREELAERLCDLRSQGVIDGNEETDLLQHFDIALRDINEQKAKLEVQYKQKIQDDGQDAADAWLRPLAEEIGEQHGRAAREITDRLRVVTG